MFDSMRISLAASIVPRSSLLYALDQACAGENTLIARSSRRSEKAYRSIDWAIPSTNALIVSSKKPKLVI